jgi:hypothetical protein
MRHRTVFHDFTITLDLKTLASFCFKMWRRPSIVRYSVGQASLIAYGSSSTALSTRVSLRQLRALKSHSSSTVFPLAMFRLLSQQSIAKMSCCMNSISAGKLAKWFVFEVQLKEIHKTHVQLR